jgi:hypothetical protein
VPSIDDVYDQLKQSTQLLTKIAASTQAIGSVVHSLLTLQQESTNRLTYLTREADTMICALENVSKNTCLTLNESHAQTSLQTELSRDLNALLTVFKLTNAVAAQQYAEFTALKEQIEKCCPPTVPPPFCTYEPCPSPAPVEDGPSQY